MAFPTILIVDDEPTICQSLSGLLSDEGYEVTSVLNGYEALKLIEMDSPDIVLLDIWMPGIDGIETLKEIKKKHPLLPVIIITGHGTIETAVNAVKIGAYDMIEKPLSIERVIVTINNALHFRRIEEENRYLRKKMIEKNSLTGTSPAIMALKKQIAQVAPSDSWILISGEHGTGKELVARTIHQFSSRAEQSFIDVNCAAISEEVLEIELFGQEKTPYSSRKTGKFELASKGTLFLDEIGDMSLKTQAKLLRVLQEQRFHRIEGARPITVDVRVIASSNKNLVKEIEKGAFREDLFYRLNVIPIEVPPLRHRLEDIPLLTNLFLNESAQQNKCLPKRIASDALDMLCRYSWPGNVRELKNLITRLVLMVESDEIKGSDIPYPYNPGAAKGDSSIETQLFSTNNLKQAVREFEKEFIRRKLAINHHQIEFTAKQLGVSTKYLLRHIEQ